MSATDTSAPVPPAPSAASALPPLDVAETLRGKRVLFIGSTGFVGKVALSMLLRRYPDLGQVFALVRPGAGFSAEGRFFQKIAASRPFLPVREAFGDATEAFLRQKVTPLAGDVSQVGAGIAESALAEIASTGGLDAIINCAGLVSFNPSLESALRINVNGVRNTIDLCRRFDAALIHVSTCFVAGNRDGEIYEDEPVIGYFPRRPGLNRPHGHDRRRPRLSELRDDDFSAETEVADCERLIAQVRARADDRAHVSLFRDRGAQRLQKEGRDPDDERHLKAAVQRERKLWLSEQLTELGMERARHWGWPNTYTYTKSLGDQLCALAASRPGPDGKTLRVSIVRPAIVESALSYPFPGWNEGFNTTAPLIFMVLRGHQQVPAGKDSVLDVIPVDMVSAGLIAATAATLADRHQLIYQLGSSDSNPFRVARSVELTGLYKRRYYRARTEDSVLNRVRARLESFPVTAGRFEATSLPVLKGAFSRASALLQQKVPTWGAPRLSALMERAKDKLDDAAQLAGQGQDIFTLFMPFIHDNAIAFRCDNARALYQSLTPQDQLALPWIPDQIHWREYFLNIHLPGLEKWIFPSLDEEFQARPRATYTYRDLLELFAAATKHYRGRTAMRLLPPPGPDGELQGTGQRFTYRDLRERALRVAGGLQRRGVVAGDKVLLLSENRPEWGITYFGVLAAGAIAVPVDHQATADEVINIARAAKARALITSDKVAERLGLAEEPGVVDAAAAALRAALGDAALLRFDDLDEPVSGVALRSRGPVPSHVANADGLASLIFTSGTTGKPKGVMLSHRNFTSLLAKIGAVFDVDKHDGLLSVLPLHHTFEFTTGLLLPLMRGAQISYLNEVNQESLQAAFREAHVTGMVGVPALWQLLYRRITRTINENPVLESPWLLRLFEALWEGARKLRDKLMDALGFDANLGRLLFYPVHRRFGGRLRLLISGGSALPPELMKAYWGMGFNLYEGYGLTESAPVLTTTRPGQPLALGSVGQALSGVDVRLHEPDASGVGEIIASGPNVMLGYYEDPEATAATLKDGFLHTGDLGRFDEERRLYIVGRKKEVIIGLNGENVYPDELEDLYRDSPYVKEISIVGLPVEGEKGGEVVASLIVPEYEPPGETLSREAVRERLREHVRAVSAKLPLPKRLKVLHLVDGELPKTATRKVRRKQVVEEIRKLERAQRQGAAFKPGAGSGDGQRDGGVWLLDLLAQVTGRPRDKVSLEATMQELGIDSLTYAELAVALEAAGVQLPEQIDLTSVATVAELWRLVERHRSDKPRAAPRVNVKRSASKEDQEDSERLNIPAPLRSLGNQGLSLMQRMLYERVLETRVTGQAYLPRASRFIVAANHASHLDMGLVKHALGDDWGPRLVALAAKDYFFDDPLKRAYFENFTNLIPMDRHGSIRESLRLAEEVIHEGSILLIFPEGTRSENGVMRDFKPSIGYLSLKNQIDVVPMYLSGTHDAMPKGRALPRRKTIAAHIGPTLTYQALRKAVEGLPKNEHNREVARIVEAAVRRMAPPGPNRVMSARLASDVDG